MSPRAIIKRVCDRRALVVARFRHDRHRAYVDARAIVSFVARWGSCGSAPDIAWEMGGIDHATVLLGCDRVLSRPDLFDAALDLLAEDAGLYARVTPPTAGAGGREGA